jgi:hypothetical protein
MLMDLQDAFANPKLTERQTLIDLLQQAITTGRLGPGDQVLTELRETMERLEPQSFHE